MSASWRRDRVLAEQRVTVCVTRGAVEHAHAGHRCDRGASEGESEGREMEMESRRAQAARELRRHGQRVCSEAMATSGSLSSLSTLVGRFTL